MSQATRSRFGFTLRCAWVTGASSGIGRSFAIHLAPLVERLVVVARDRRRLEELASSFETLPVRVEIHSADLADDDALRAAAAALALDAPDLLINNAGFGTRGRFAELDGDEEDREVALNVRAPLRLTRAALPAMVRRGGGGIINVSSLAGETPTPFSAVYGATKAFLTDWTESLHEELRGTGVRVQALLPGFTRTEFQQRAGIAPDEIPRFAWLEADRVVEESLRALERDRLVCVPGRRYRALRQLARWLPRTLLRRLAGAGARSRLP